MRSGCNTMPLSRETTRSLYFKPRTNASSNDFQEAPSTRQPVPRRHRSSQTTARQHRPQSKPPHRQTLPYHRQIPYRPPRSQSSHFKTSRASSTKITASAAANKVTVASTHVVQTTVGSLQRLKGRLYSNSSQFTSLATTS